MTLELQKRITHAENFSTDLVHEIRNPLASLKSASEILKDSKDIDQRLKLVDIFSKDFHSERPTLLTSTSIFFDIFFTFL